MRRPEFALTALLTCLGFSLAMVRAASSDELNPIVPGASAPAEPTQTAPIAAPEASYLPYLDWEPMSEESYVTQAPAAAVCPTPCREQNSRDLPRANYQSLENWDYDMCANLSCPLAVPTVPAVKTEVEQPKAEPELTGYDPVYDGCLYGETLGEACTQEAACGEEAEPTVVPVPETALPVALTDALNVVAAFVAEKATPVWNKIGPNSQQALMQNVVGQIRTWSVDAWTNFNLSETWADILVANEPNSIDKPVFISIRNGSSDWIRRLSQEEEAKLMLEAAETIDQIGQSLSQFSSFLRNKAASRGVATLRPVDSTHR